MKLRLGVVLSLAVLSVAADAAAAGASGVIVQDHDRSITVRYAATAGQVVISSEMPKGWDLGVNVDGDQDGHWGLGPYTAASEKFSGPTKDLAFGRDQDGFFCGQYVYAWDPQQPDSQYLKSECGGFPSKGSIEITGPDAQGRVLTRLKIPTAELFGSKPEAHLQVCVWDKRQWSCYFSPAAPFVLRRSDIGAPAKR